MNQKPIDLYNEGLKLLAKGSILIPNGLTLAPHPRTQQSVQVADEGALKQMACDLRDLAHDLGSEDIGYDTLITDLEAHASTCEEAAFELEKNAA